MAKEEKPLEYQRRSRNTKGVAQRIDLDYLKRPAWDVVLRRRVTWIAIAAAAAAGIPLVLGVAGAKRALLPGTLSTAHGLFENRCEVCHAQRFAVVADSSCKTCHDGAPHPAKSFDTARADAAPACAECHVEHRGSATLAAVANGNCTECHANLQSHARGVKLTAANITAFASGKHPDFPTASLMDTRPIKLNHAIHMPTRPVTIRGMKLPMHCVDCHRTDPASSAGEPLPVTFEQNCRSCHARELEFDVYGVLGATPYPAPHTRDAQSIRQFIADSYRQALAAKPEIARRPLGNELNAAPSAAAWLDRVVRDSEAFLFQRKCTYCHEGSGTDAAVQKVNRIQGRYMAGQPEGEPWLPRGEFSHRMHRAVDCESCHASARASTRTSDVLIPHMQSCLPCHQQSAAGLDRCSTCHLYHNRSLEKENRRPTRVVTGGAP
jgi:hypothetical protein